MKKIIIFLGIFFFIYIFTKFMLHDFIFGHDINYKIKDEKNTFEINEVLNLKRNQGLNNYYFKIKHNKKEYNFKINNEFNKDIKIIEDIKYYKDENYECILPIFKDNKKVIDMMCYYNDQLYFNYNLPKNNSKIFKKYDLNKYKDNKKELQKNNVITLYDNLINNHYLAVDNYKGLYLINKKHHLEDIKLFKKDVYETKLKEIVDNKIIIADYNKKYDFNKFLTINIKNGKKDEFIVNYDINFNSYINGVYQGNVYLTDKDEKIQYKIDPNSKLASIISNKNKGLIYENNTLKDISISKLVNNEIKFQKLNKKIKNYDYNVKYQGNYYLFKKENNYYKVFLAPIENIKIPIYIFKITNLDNIYFIDDYIYFINENNILYYNYKTGVKTILNNKEYEFNKSLRFYVMGE